MTTVRLYDVPSKTVRNIPAAELSSDCMFGVVEGVGEVYVETSQISRGPVRHQTLPDDLCRRTRLVRVILKGLGDSTQKEWEDSFKRDLHPEREVMVWERIAEMVKQHGGRRELTRMAVYQVALHSSLAGHPDDVVKLLHHGVIRFLGRERVEEIAYAYFVKMHEEYLNRKDGEEHLWGVPASSV